MTATSDIRPAVPADSDVISALTRRAYSTWIALTGREPLPMQVDYREAIRVHDFALIEDAGKLLGLIETVPEVDALLIVSVAVEPTSQGQGVGGG